MDERERERDKEREREEREWGDREKGQKVERKDCTCSLC